MFQILAIAPNQVYLDPAHKDGSWCVFFDGRVVADGYNSKGAAEAALGLYVSGYRKPPATHCEHGTRKGDFCSACEQHKMG
jgi:hypothetical protein